VLREYGQTSQGRPYTSRLLLYSYKHVGRECYFSYDPKSYEHMRNIMQQQQQQQQQSGYYLDGPQHVPGSDGECE